MPRTTLEEVFKKMSIPQDKANHMVYGFIVYGLLYMISPSIALTGTIGVAIAKEVYDMYFGGTVDWKDYIATIIIPIVIELNIYLNEGCLC